MMKKRKILIPLFTLAVIFPSATNVFADPLKPTPVKSVEFIGMEAPNSDLEKSKMYSEASVLVTYKNGNQKTIPLEYKSLLQPGDTINGKIAGATYDVRKDNYKR